MRSPTVRRPHRLAFALTAAVALVAAASAGMRAHAQLGPAPQPSPVVYPRQILPLSFSHAQHAGAELGLRCAVCHPGAKTSTRAADSLVPPESVCARCHPIDRSQPDKPTPPGKPAAACAVCHPGWDGRGLPQPLVIPPANLRFNHRIHAERGIGCARCHGDRVTTDVGLATRADLPRMASCLACHDGKTTSARCSTCHLAEASGRLRTQFAEGTLEPSGVLRGDAHDLDWARHDHARLATSHQPYCENCHAKRDCLRCHDGVLKPTSVHDADYVARHPIDARRDSPRCSACHRLQSFCTGCHARSGVADDRRTSSFERPAGQATATRASRTFHPESWNAAARGRNHHAQQARHNLRSCVSCHREGSCLECHRDAFRPHDAGWEGSSRCRALRQRNPRVCTQCHSGGADCR